MVTSPCQMLQTSELIRPVFCETMPPMTSNPTFGQQLPRKTERAVGRSACSYRRGGKTRVEANNSEDNNVGEIRKRNINNFIIRLRSLTTDELDLPVCLSFCHVEIVVSRRRAINGLTGVLALGNSQEFEMTHLCGRPHLPRFRGAPDPRGHL